MIGGIRINVLEALREENAQIFYILSCREGILPIKHMHIPVSDKMLYSADLIGVGVKVEKKASSLARLVPVLKAKSILIESSMSSLPSYITGVYMLPDKVHHKMDAARPNFF
jgi:hypothetical protein